MGKKRKLDDSTRSAGPVLLEPDKASLIPAGPLKFKQPKGIGQRVAAKGALVGAKEAELGPTRAKPERRAVVVVGPITEKAVADGIIDADHDGGIVAPIRSQRATIARWAQLRISEPGLTNVEIAKRLQVTSTTLNAYITRGKREGWLRFEDPMTRMEYEIVPKAVAGLSELLDRKDKTAIIETAKGTLYPMFRDSKGVTEQVQTVLALKIERADGDNMKIVTGHIVGKSKAKQETE